MAYNLSLSLQHDMGLVQKHSTNPKRPRLYQSWKWKTFRFLILNRAGRIGWEQGTKVLYLTPLEIMPRSVSSPAIAEILSRVIILQLVRFPSVNRDEVIILHDGASPANNEN